MSVTLQGTLLGNGAPFDGATVEAYSVTGADMGGTTTAGGGLYSLSLDPGVYKLNIVAGGYPSVWYGAANLTGAREIILVADPLTVDLAIFSSSSRFSLNGVPVRVWDYAGFDLPAFASIVPLLSDTAGAGSVSQAIQTGGGLPGREATFGCTLRNWTDVQTLRGWNASKETLTWIDAYGDTVTVILFDFAATTKPGGIDPSAGLGLWDYTMTLVEAYPDGAVS